MVKPYEQRFPWHLDWNLLRTFMVVVEQRGISRAAYLLGLKQPTISAALKRLSPELVAFVQASLKLCGLKELASHAEAAAEMRAQGVRPNARGNGFALDGVDDDDDSWLVRFDARLLAEARGAIEAALATLPDVRSARARSAWSPASGFLSGSPAVASAAALATELATPNGMDNLPLIVVRRL